MASPETDVALGLSFTFGTTVIDDRKIIDFQLPGPTVELLPGSHQGLTNALKVEPADLADAGKFRCTVYHFQEIDIWAEIGTKDTLVITTPSGATLTFTSGAILESYEVQQATLNGRMIADVVFQLTKKPSIVAGA